LKVETQVKNAKNKGNGNAGVVDLLMVIVVQGIGYAAVEHHRTRN
jgi:hypothetical protein